ncbi:MAG: hypothetical protein IJQ08_05815 [Synergistaceae bacterium]|nr:hypothetical protein [Synergistaceae bacterium]MBR0185208.1 hypothetical protein [Synergistaceae bacterium]
MVDSELLEKMFHSQHGAKIRALFCGDISAYDDDESRADLALCSYLAFWTNNDLPRMDALFRQSGLMRQKQKKRKHFEQNEKIHTLRRTLTP